MSIEQARFNMIEQQIRPSDAIDQAILELIAATPREKFVGQQFQHLAFSDSPIPIGHNQMMMTPLNEARMLQALQIQEQETVLEIGTGSGFVTALLSQLAEQVTSEELFADLSHQAGQTLASLKLDQNVDLMITDSLQNRPFFDRFDKIVITASMPNLDYMFQQQLNIGGSMFVIVGEDPLMEARLLTRLAEREWQHQNLYETNVPALVGAVPIDQFEL